MSGNLEIKTEQRANALVIHVVGDAGMANVGRFESALTPIFALKPKLVVVDASKMTFISSIGMGTLVTFARGIERAGGTVMVAALQPPMADAFKRARLSEVLKIRSTVEEATGPSSASK